MSASASTGLGPISAALVAELREEARKHGVLVWLDKDATYTPLVDALVAGGNGFPFPLLAYRGSFLELMVALEGLASGVTMEPLVVHLPGFNEKDVAETPLYELYQSGRRHRIALPTLVRKAAEQKVAPKEIEAFLKREDLSVDAADTWLQGLTSGDASAKTELPVHSAEQLFDDLVNHGAASRRLDEPGFREALFGFLERTLGLDAEWRSAHGSLSGPQDLQLLLSSWALSVEFVDDLRREPHDSFLKPLTKLPESLVRASCRLAAHIRDRHPAIYVRDADQVEADLIEELRGATAEDLGKIDTLRFEDRKLFGAALDALRDGGWSRAAGYAADRTKEESIWVRLEPLRGSGWEVLRRAAALGLRCAEREDLLVGAASLEAIADRYAQGGFEVDAAQRLLEQAYSVPNLIQLDEFPALRERVNAVRSVYRRWADAQAIAFNAVCTKHGFLPSAPLQQRTLFEEVVRPAAEANGTVAFFLVDAMRFEMGEQLMRSLGTEAGARMNLKPRYAELPTLTEVGMNVLPPVARDGRVRMDGDVKGIRGFRAGEARVMSPETRRKAMHERVGGETCPMFSVRELLAKDATSIRRSISRARLVLVYSEGIDKAGEEGVGLRHFEDELQRLRAAWFLLREVGVSSFVMTADHGFLLQDETTLDPVPHGRKTDPKRRHVIENSPADNPGEVRVSSFDLGYDGYEVQFMFPQSTMPFDTGAKSKNFLHGGNSLQERVIPVITATYRHGIGGTAAPVLVEARAEAGVMGLHRIRGTVSFAAQAGLDFGRTREIELRLDAVDDPDVAVELVEAPGARIQAGVLVVSVDASFELLFRLTGQRPLKTRVRLRPASGGDEVSSATLERRFAVDVVGTAAPSPAGADAVDTDWLDALPEGVKAVFEHLSRFGAINEADATRILGSPRAFRRFSQRFEGFAEKAPFEVRIEVSNGQKRYVRDGG